MTEVTGGPRREAPSFEPDVRGRRSTRAREAPEKTAERRGDASKSRGDGEKGEVFIAVYGDRSHFLLFNLTQKSLRRR